MTEMEMMQAFAEIFEAIAYWKFHNGENEVSRTKFIELQLPILLGYKKAGQALQALSALCELHRLLKAGGYDLSLWRDAGLSGTDALETLSKGVESGALEFWNELARRGDD